MRALLLVLLIGCSSPPGDPAPEAVDARGTDPAPRTRHLEPDGSPTFTNRLAQESSPYLVQHAHNPVDWFPWGEEAFAKAEAEGKPVLLSVGYSTCHWCHVMEEESFEDLEIAAFLNEHFVAIKVDREERPDVDATYMAATRALTGRGGWPMTVLLTPGKEPFFAGTYFPARTGDRGTREGFLPLLQRLQARWATDRGGLVSEAEKLSRQVKTRDTLRPGEAIGTDQLIAGAKSIAAGFDPEFAGFGRTKKFPRPSNLALLLRYHRRTGDAHALEVVTRTLHAMADGGIHDQIGGGFHRYTVDRRWQVPHFEKMLYDNAQLVGLFLDAWLVTGEERFADVVRSTLEYLSREMSHAEGGFFSATDADSAGPDGQREEGLFFTWTPGELRDALGPEGLPLAISAWGVTTKGNFEGRTVLHRPRSLDEVARDLGQPADVVQQRLTDAAATLHSVRAERPPPLRDDKILAAWNGLAISAFARAGRVFGEPAWTARAAQAADFVLRRMRTDGRLRRSWTEGALGPNAFLEDHAFLIGGLLDLFEAEGDARWLAEAKALDQELATRFEAPDGGWFRTAHDAEALLLRERPHTDGVQPSGNGAHILNLLRLEAWTTDAAYGKRADAALAVFAGEVRARAAASPSLLMAADWRSDEPMEVVVVGGGALAEVPRSVWTPNAVVWTHRTIPAVPWLDGKGQQDGAPTAYVCHEGLCKAPTADPETLRAQIAKTLPVVAPPLKPSSRGATPAPWQYNEATGKHWHPGHRHWHDGPPPNR